MVQDLAYADDWGYSNQEDHGRQLINLEIYIGSSEDWADNQKCPGGPFLSIEDTSLYIDEDYSNTNIPVRLWPNGIEAWCNMEGRFVTLVADYNPIKNDYAVIEPSVCDLGIFGTNYIRDFAVPEKFELYEGEV